MPKGQYDAIVIGSGPGGSACATLLQKRGIDTLLIEKNSFFGGKMTSRRGVPHTWRFLCSPDQRRAACRSRAERIMWAWRESL